MMQVRIGNKLYTSGSHSSRTRWSWNNFISNVASAPAWVKWPAIAYLVAAFIYMAYCEETQSGLVGYIMAIEMERFGSTTGASGMGVFLLAIPLIAFVAIARTLAPRLFEPHVTASPTPSLRQPISWKRVFAISAIPLIATLVAVPLASYAAQARLNEPVYALNLGSAEPTIPVSGSRVRVTGRIAKPYIAAYRYGNQTHSTDHLYVPVTAPTWNPVDPVRFVVHETVPVSDWNAAPQLPFELSQSGPVQIQGRLSRSLPVVIEREFRTKGVKLAPDFYVVDHTGLSAAFWAGFAGPGVAVLGLMLTLFTLYLMMLIRIRRRKQMVRTIGA